MFAWNVMVDIILCFRVIFSFPLHRSYQRNKKRVLALEALISFVKQNVECGILLPLGL